MSSLADSPSFVSPHAEHPSQPPHNAAQPSYPPSQPQADLPPELEEEEELWDEPKEEIVVERVEEERYEMRTYRIPLPTWEKHQEYFQLHGTKNYQELLWQALERLSVTRELLEMANSEFSVPEGFLPMLGRHLGRDLEILEKLAGFLSEMELVHIQSYARS